MFEIIFYEGTNKIKFGMDSNEISETLNTKPLISRKGGVKNPIDEYDFCFIYYNDYQKCEGIEFFPPTDIRLDNVSIIGNSTSTVRLLLERWDTNLKVETPDIYHSEKMSVGIYGENGIVESVYVGVKGCYSI